MTVEGTEGFGPVRVARGEQPSRPRRNIGGGFGAVPPGNQRIGAAGQLLHVAADDRVKQRRARFQGGREVGHRSRKQRFVALGPESRDLVAVGGDRHRGTDVVRGRAGDIPAVHGAHASWPSDGDRPVDLGRIGGVEPREDVIDSGCSQAGASGHRSQRGDQQDDAKVGVGARRRSRGFDGRADRKPERLVRRPIDRGGDGDRGGDKVIVGQVGKRRRRMHVAGLRGRGLEDAGGGGTPATAPRGARDGRDGRMPW